MALPDVTSRYELEKELGRGGMGTVYRAHDKASGQLVAVKVLRRKLVRDLLRFSREVGMLSNLHHPNIVRYLDHGQLTNGKPVLVMEWVEGEPLLQRMQGTGLTLAQAVQCVTAVAEALGAAHAQGVVHRDIKPDNILLTGDRFDAVKLIDFGIARRIGDLVTLTRTGMRVGTPAYMSPEQARGVRDVDARADVFMLGTLLYECVTGKHAFSGASAQALLGKIIVVDPIPIDLFAPEAPAALVALVERMMCKAPSGRPEDARVVAHELAELGSMPDGPARRLEERVDEDGKHRSSGVETRLDRAKPRNEQTFVMLMVPPDEDDDLDEDDDTIENTARGHLVQALRDEGVRHGMRVEVLGNGSILGLLSSAEPPATIATRLAECALSVKRWAPEVSVACLSDRPASSTANETVGATIERGFASLETVALRAITLAHGGEAGVVHLDAMIAKLLEGRFRIEQDNDEYHLLATGT